MHLHVAKIKSRAVTRQAVNKYDVTNKKCSNSFRKHLTFLRKFCIFSNKVNAFLK